MAELVEHLTGDQRAACSSLTACGVIMLCNLLMHCIRCLLLVQPWKFHPDMIENVLTGTLRIKTNKLHVSPG